MYNNDVRVANTATPSFQSQVNVGGFGWTGADQGHYNQLIQYVDECRKIYISLGERIDYVEGLITQVQGIEEQVAYVTQKSNEVAEDARQVSASVAGANYFYNEVRAMYTYVKPMYEDFLIKYEDILAKHKESTEAATNAAASELGAKSWYDKSYDLYLDLKEGQVYRGTWNPSSGAFPDNQGTNSVWDVILDAGQTDVSFGGFTWRNGDRLLYIVAESKYDQLSTGSGVTSINGKVGAVTLINTDVNAAPQGFGLGESQAYTVSDLNSDPLTWNGGKMGWIRGISSTTNRPEDQSGTGTIQRYQSGDTSIVWIKYLGHNGKTYTRRWSGTSWDSWRITYDTSNKPSATDVGALSVNGGTLAGQMYVDVGDSAEPRLGTRRSGRIQYMSDNGSTVGIYTNGFSGLDPSWMVNRNVMTGAITAGDARSSFNVDGKEDTFTYKSKKVFHEGRSFGLGARQGAAMEAINYTEDKTGDFDKLITAGEYSVSGSWVNGPNNKGPDVSETWIAQIKVEVRHWGAGTSYVQSLKWSTNGTYTTKTRQGTGTYPNITWTPWVFFGPNEIESQYRICIDRPQANAYPYITLHKRDIRTDLTSGWYDTGAIQFKGFNKTDENNSDSGDILGNITMSRDYRNQYNRLSLNLRKASDKSTASEVHLYEDKTSLVAGGKAANWDGANLALDGKKVYHEGYKPTATDVGARPNTWVPTPAEIGAVSLSGANVGANAHGVDFTNNASGTWIASNHGNDIKNNTASRVVMGTLNNGAVIGGHLSDMSNWSALYLNTYPTPTENQEQASVIMSNPKRQLAIQSDAGIPTGVHFPVVTRGSKTGHPNWWIGQHALRFADGRDLMNAATNGLRLNHDWVYMNRFKYTVRLEVSAPSIGIWAHVYGFEIYNYQSTNSTDAYELPAQFSCHAQAGLKGKIMKQMVPSTENGGMPYFELHFDPSLNVTGASDLSVNLVIIAENIFE